MTVYIDDYSAKYRRMIMCHMVADTEDELHAMADKIGINRAWYQSDHYDVCLSKKNQAIKCGAVPITWRVMGKMRIRLREDGKLGLPSEADAWFTDYINKKK